MSDIELSFFKLNVPDMEAALAFWQQAFGFTVFQTFDEDDFIEHMMALPGQQAGPNLLLVQTKPAREMPVGPGHGPVGLKCSDIAAAHERAIAAGAQRVTGIFPVGDGIQVAMLKSPEGHEIELVQIG